MELIIGRDPTTSKLRVVDGNTGAAKLYGNAGCVPKDVSRQHCEIKISDDGRISIKNLKAENITYVNGLEVLAKNISETDTVQIGHSKFAVDLPMILKDLIPKVVDIRPLEKVWNDYNEKVRKLKIEQGRLNALSRVSGIFSMLAIASGLLLKGQDNYLYYWLYGAAILLTVGFTVVSYVNASRIPQKLEELDEQFMRDYVCPNPECHRFLGKIHYSVLSQNSCCQFCKVKYRK